MGFFSNFLGSGPEMSRNLSPRTAQSGDAIVVTATEGPMPSTRQEMQARAATGATSLCVHLVDATLVGDEELVELVELEIREVASSYGFTQVEVEWFA